MITWGISANSHDAALAVFERNKLVFASHSERFSRIKNDPHLHEDLITYAKQWGEPDKVVWYEKPFKKTLRQFFAGQGWNRKENNIRQYLDSYEIQAPYVSVDHHHSHAAGGYYTSGYNDAAVVVIDSIGEFETFTIWDAKDNKLKKVFSQSYPDSIGLWYSAMTQRIGLTPNEDEYILMGMAAYGRPNRLFHDILDDFVQDTYTEQNDPTVYFTRNLHRGCKDWRPDLHTEQDMFDIAAATQLVYEYILNKIIKYAKSITKSDNIVFMGGCALNCSANYILKHHFKNAWIMPNPGDAGSAVGAVLAYWKQHIEWPGANLGYKIEGDYPVDLIINELLTTGIAGVANGPAEFGPRALGNRSLLADPRGDDTKDRVNKIKLRQAFRPFAPAILAEHADEYFKGNKNEYMQYTSTCLYPDKLPAIAHVDNTSRVQIVPADNSGLRRLLEAWYAKTGCPMLLNTSLNIKGRPMVNDKQDAVAFEKQYGIKVFS